MRHHNVLLNSTFYRLFNTSESLYRPLFTSDIVTDNRSCGPFVRGSFDVEGLLGPSPSGEKDCLTLMDPGNSHTQITFVKRNFSLY